MGSHLPQHTCQMPKGPVLLNYGTDEGRFTKPVYPGMTIQVRLPVPQAGYTVKAFPLRRDYEASSRSFGKKVDQEKRDENDVAKGKACSGPRRGVKFLVDVFDETVAVAPILTMMRKIDQS